MHTQREAERLWCPFARVQIWQRDERDNPPVNRPEANVNCIGRDCMAWRWGETETEVVSRWVSFGAAQERPRPDGPEWSDRYTDSGYHLGWERTRANRRGYCGLAGKPED